MSADGRGREGILLEDVIGVDAVVDTIEAHVDIALGVSLETRSGRAAATLKMEANFGRP